MPRINLLPWREQERKVRRREFMVAAAAAVFAAEDEDDRGKYRAAGCDRELTASDFAFLFAPGK